MMIIHVYALTTNEKKRRLMSFMIKSTLKSTQDMQLVIEDCNAKIENTKEEKVIGLYGFGT